MSLPLQPLSNSEPILGTHPHPRAGYGMPRRSPVKDMTLRRLVDAALSVCEPENVDETATAYTRSALIRKFSAILYPSYKRF